MLNNKVALRIISLIIAVLLWMYVMGEVNPEISLKVGNIPVTFTNTELLANDDLAVVENAPITVSAIIKGKRSKVNEAAADGLTATVDVRSCTKGKNDREISVNLPSGISLDSISVESLEFQVEERVTEEKPVQVDFVGDISDGKLVPWSGDYDYLYIKASGAQSSVKKVDAVKGTISIDDLGKDNRDFYIDLTPVDSNGNTIYGIDLSSDAINVSAQLLTAKKVKLNLIKENLSSDLEVENTTVQDTVKIIGSADDIKGIEEVDGVLDMSSVSSAGKYNLKVELVNLPAGIYKADTKKDIKAVVWVIAAE